MACRRRRAGVWCAVGLMAAAVAGCGSSRPSSATGTSTTPGPTTSTGATASTGAETSTGATTSTTSTGATTSTGLTTSAGPTIPTGPATGSASTWSTFHADQARSGAVSGPSFAPARVVWSAALGAKVYGEPLVAAHRVFAATEGDRVVALDPSSGRLLWSTSIGVPLSDVDAVAGCGNIDPLGITSTPVVDTATGTIYAVGEVDAGGAVRHRLVGLDVATGAIKVSDDVDPPLPAGESPINLLQRAGLALANGRVYIGYGGQYGDCGHYHGWVVAVAETGAPALTSFEVASDGEGGAIWQSGGAPAVDAAGDVYVSTGNANPTPPEGGPDPKLYTESVVRLSPSLQPLASFKDEVAGGDEDLSTANPVLLPDGDLFAVGKTDIGYVLRQRDLSQVTSIRGVCGSDPDGGPVYDQADDQMFVPCRDGGIQVIDLRAGKAGRVLRGANSTPILVGADVWALQYGSGRLSEWAASGGAAVQTVDVGAVATFASPSSALGLMLVPTAAGVTALAGPAGVHVDGG